MGNALSWIFSNRAEEGEQDVNDDDNAYMYAFHIPKEDLRFRHIIHEGTYSSVHSGTLRKTKRVAIKTSKQNSCSGHLKYLLAEAKALSQLHGHPNVISLAGVYKNELQSGVMYIAMEVCSAGSLDNYLQRHRLKPNKYFRKEGLNNDSAGMSELWKFSGEIAAGMEYIASKNFVHCDLAARNVLLDAKLTCRIGGFVMAKRIYSGSDCSRDSTERLSWKWMAPESLERLVFSEKSDVWSFGVTLWEIYSLGGDPLPNVKWSPEFITVLKKGLKLKQPPYSPRKIYNMMLNCWQILPESRPTFSHITTHFAKPYIME